MSYPITGVSGAVLNAALDALSQRQETIAHNIANVDTPGFRAQSLAFENSLLQAAQSVEQGDTDLVAEVTLENTNTPVGVNGNNVDLRKETLAAVQTQFTYQLAARAAGDQYALLKIAAGTY